MRQLLIHKMRILPNDHDLMQLTLDDVRSLQSQLQQELSKLSSVNLNFFINRKTFQFNIFSSKFRLNKLNRILFNKQHPQFQVHQLQTRLLYHPHHLHHLVKNNKNIIQTSMFLFHHLQNNRHTYIYIFLF